MTIDKCSFCDKDAMASLCHISGGIIVRKFFCSWHIANYSGDRFIPLVSQVIDTEDYCETAYQKIKTPTFGINRTNEEVPETKEETLGELATKLKDAVSDEDFKRAVEIRDKIKQFKKEHGNGHKDVG